MADRRFLIVQPWWRQPRVQNWTGLRDPLRYIVVEDVHWAAYVAGGERRLEHRLIARAWTFRGALHKRETAR